MSEAEHMDVLIIGGGVAGASAATTLRDAGFDGKVVLLTRGLDVPCDRPPGSKNHLRGESSVARQWLGEDEPYATAPYFLSDLADWVSLESVTVVRDFDRVQIEGSLDDDAFAVWLLQGDTPLGYASSNGACDLDRGRAVLKAGGPVPSA